MRNILLILLFLPLLISCRVYEMSSQPRITHVLAINSLGEQVNVPINSIILRNNPYFYTNWKFYWGNTWYWGYNWYNYVYDPYWRPRLSKYYVNYRPNLRNYTFHKANRGNIHRNSSVKIRRNINYRPNLRNYTFHKANRGNTHRNSSVKIRQNVNYRPVMNRNTENRVIQRIKVNTTSNRRITLQNRANRTSRRDKN